MAQDVLTNVADAAQRKAKEFADASQKTWDSVKEKSLEDLLGEAKEWVKKNPGKTLLGALAAGYLIGRLLRRR